MLTADDKWARDVRDVREEEVPSEVWQFSLWLREIWAQRGNQWSAEDQEEVIREAASRGITLHWDGVIEYEKH